MGMELRSRATMISVFILTMVSICSGMELQSLIPGPLPSPPSLKPDLPWSVSETAAASLAEAPPAALGLRLRLEHIDALASNATAEDLFKARLRRDALRAQSLSAISAGAGANRTAQPQGYGGRSGFSSSIVSGLAQGSGEYFTRLGIGTPALNNYLVLDTGSDINWIQCARCKRCYSQKDRIFDPSISTSFRRVTCLSGLCGLLDTHACSADRKTCLYEVSYGDGSFTTGELVTETLTFRGARIADVPMGCGHDNEGLFVGAAGLLGLGQGRLSFPTRVGERFGRKFSYCLVDRSASSKPSSLMFGEGAVSRKAVFTPLVRNPKISTFYYVGLTGFSVGGSPVRGVTAAQFRPDRAGNGGIIVDSGTSVTRLVRPAYNALRDAFRGAARLRLAAGFSLFDACYDMSGLTTVAVPRVALHFGRVEVALPAANYLIPVDARGTFCLAFAPTDGALSIIGNIQQQGMRVVFDLAGSRVGFAPNSCA